MDLVWASTLGASRKLVALSYANSAHDEDGRAWASLAYLQRRTGLDRKTIINAITALEKVGFLSDTGERRGKTNSIKVYMVAVPKTELHSSAGNGGKLYRNSQEAVPFFPRSSTENGTQRRTGDVLETLGDIASSAKALSTGVNGKGVAFIPLVDGTEFGLCEDELAELKKAYPALDCKQTMLEIRAWCVANPTKRKTKRGAMRFINSWMARLQDRAR